MCSHLAFPTSLDLPALCFRDLLELSLARTDWDLPEKPAMNPTIRPSERVCHTSGKTKHDQDCANESTGMVFEAHGAA